MAQQKIQSTFRDSLHRVVNPNRAGMLCVAMLNPSKAEAADPSQNDPTVSFLMGLTQRMKLGRLVVVNAYRFRATDQADLYAWLRSIPEKARAAHRKASLDIALEFARGATKTIGAWGNGDLRDGWPMNFGQALVLSGISLWHLGLNANGAPRHPLYTPTTRKPELWRMRAKHPQDFPAPHEVFTDAA